jgi:hypothetical protein
MQVNEQDCEKWKKDPTINPLTGRKIKDSGPVYKQLKRACNPPFSKSDCERWKRDKTRHPVTKRKLNMNAKNGIFAQLKKICDSPARDLLEAHKTKLISALKKTIAPILHKGDTSMARIKFAAIMKKYLTVIKPCLTEQNGKLCLVDEDNKPLVYFEKRIGTDSVYGVAYLNAGKGLAKLLKFSCKLMSNNVPGNQQEIKILKKMSDLVTNGKSPNMPLIYKTLRCSKKCTLQPCPPNIKNNGYYVVINELANSDLETWFEKQHSPQVYESIVMQLLFAMYSFHSLGYIHNDCHLRNFLIHHIKPGGCWRYEIVGHNVYVPNHGYQLVLWDPGRAKPFKSQKHEHVFDYVQPLALMQIIHLTFKDQRMKPLRGLAPFLTSIQQHETEKAMFEDIIVRMKANDIEMKSIVIDDVPPSHLLNVKAYKL